jgi:formylglycine-generating enzyme required for sulfatase activity
MISGLLRVCALGAVIAIVGCRSESDAAGFVLVQVDTDLPVPKLLNRVRVDVYSDEGVWLSSRDYPVAFDSPRDAESKAAPQTGAVSFPLSFALEPSGTRTEALVRVRGYRETKVRDYLGERYEPPPNPPVTIGRTPCEALPELSLESSVELDVFGSRSSDESIAECNGVAPASAIAAAGLTIEKAGTYRLSIDRISPNGAWQSYSRPVIYVVEDCEQQGPVIACGELGLSAGDLPLAGTGLTVDLSAGSYVVLLGNQVPANMEARLVLQSDVPSEPGGPSDPVGEEPEGEPRLVIDDLDVTPRTEPEPGLAVDRLARIEVAPDEDKSVRLMLYGDCLGIMANLEERASCVGGPGQKVVSLDLEPRSNELGHVTHTKSGQWDAAQARACEAEGDDIKACIPGGAFTLGDSSIVAAGADATTPEKVVLLSPFYLDKREFTVRRYRELLGSGALPEHTAPVNNLEPLDFATGGVDGNYCTYNVRKDGQPLFPAREDLPLTCVSWEAARAICQAAGGDLPTSAQWEYAASAASGTDESLYPWGNQPPECSRAVYARWVESSRGHTECLASGFGPVAVTMATEDVTKLGVEGLGGNVSEWTLDSHRAYGESCWVATGAMDHRCEDEAAPLRTVKGGSWRQAGAYTRAPSRLGAPATAVDDGVGFRCAYVSEGSADP